MASIRPWPRSANDNSGDPGLFSWDLSTDTLYADSALADLFGLQPEKTERGLPLAAYLESIHEDDRPGLAGKISYAIRTGQAIQETYRVTRSDGALVAVTAFAKCFYGHDNEPKAYVGIVFPMPEEVVIDTDLQWLCVAAIDRAKRDGHGELIPIFREALFKIGGKATSWEG